MSKMFLPVLFLTVLLVLLQLNGGGLFSSLLYLIHMCASDAAKRCYSGQNSRYAEKQCSSGSMNMDFTCQKFVCEGGKCELSSPRVYWANFNQTLLYPSTFSSFYIEDMQSEKYGMPCRTSNLSIQWRKRQMSAM